MMGIHVGNKYVIQINRIIISLTLIVQRIYYSDFTSLRTVSKDYIYVTRWGTIMTIIALVCSFFVPLRKLPEAELKGPWKIYLILF